MNIIDIIILAVLGVSVVFGLYRGFISGVLSVAALIGSAALAFALSGEMAAWLQENQTLIDTLMYYTDAGSRITNLDLSLLSVAQVTENALAQILDSARLPAAFEAAFVENIGLSEGAATISAVLSKTIVNVSISILSFLICFLIAYVILTFAIHLISYVFELPVLRHLDSLIGGVFGLARGVLLLYVLFLILPVLSTIIPLDAFNDLLSQSSLAPIFQSDGFFAKVVAEKL